MRLAVACCLLLGLAAGCFAEGDGRSLGEDLGLFSVEATLREASCGEGAFGAEERWEFEVVLSRSEGTLYWHTGGQAVPGTVASESGFSLETEVLVEWEPPAGTRPGCRIVRSDSASGTLRKTEEAVDGFAGRLAYRYSEEEGTDCSDLVGAPEGVAELPCSIEYEVTGTRVGPAPPR